MSLNRKSDHGVTIGILYAGDLGSAVGRLCQQSGLRVVTTAEGRSDKTAMRAKSAGLEVLPGFSTVVAESDLLISLVLPAAAEEVASLYVECSDLRPKGSIYIEANSLDLDRLFKIERLMEKGGIPMVDGAITGSARFLEEKHILHLSGPHAEEVGEVLAAAMNVSLLGESIGSASQLKLIQSALSKAMAATFVEVGVLAEKSAVLDSFLKTCRDFYPEILEIMERMLPTYPQHAKRRAEQLRDIDAYGESLNLSLGIIREASARVEEMAKINWDSGGMGEVATIEAIIRQVADDFSREADSKK